MASPPPEIPRIGACGCGCGEPICTKSIKQMISIRIPISWISWINTANLSFMSDPHGLGSCADDEHPYPTISDGEWSDTIDQASLDISFYDFDSPPVAWPSAALNEGEDPTVNCLGCPRIYTIVGLDEVSSGLPTGVVDYNWYGDNSRLVTSFRGYWPPIGGVQIFKSGGPSIYIGHCNGVFLVPCVLAAKIRMSGYTDTCVSVFQAGAPFSLVVDSMTIDSCGTRSPVSGVIDLPAPGEFHVPPWQRPAVFSRPV